MGKTLSAFHSHNVVYLFWGKKWSKAVKGTICRFFMPQESAVSNNNKGVG